MKMGIGKNLTRVEKSEYNNKMEFFGGENGWQTLLRHSQTILIALEGKSPPLLALLIYSLWQIVSS